MCIGYSKLDATTSINNSNEYLEESMIADLFRKASDPIKAKRKEVEARIKAFRNDLLLAISSFIELLAPLFDLELIFKLLEKKHNLTPELVSISLRDFTIIDKQYSDEYQAIFLG